MCNILKDHHFITEGPKRKYIQQWIMTKVKDTIDVVTT